jgi:hypothetical protein
MTPSSLASVCAALAPSGNARYDSPCGA